MYMNTIDLDFCDQERLEKICAKITRCAHLFYWGGITDTAKGYHIRIGCTKDCDLCRMVFDDQTRYARDLERVASSRNVLHQRKWLIRNGVETRVW